MAPTSGRNNSTVKQENMEAVKLMLYRQAPISRAEIAAQNAPKVAVTCPNCGASTLPDEHGRCEFCGGAVAD